MPGSRFPEDVRHAVVQEVTANVRAFTSWHGVPIDRACLYWALFTVRALRARKYRALIQAGTMAWPRIDEDQDDGVMHTHFGFAWEPESPVSQQQIELGNLPEVHVWAAAYPSPAMTPEIVDLTTKFLPAQCVELGSMPWLGEHPPDYLWTPANDKPARVRYSPLMPAIMYVLSQVPTNLRDAVCSSSR